MNNKLLLAMLLSTLSLNAFSSSLFDVPLAKKFYAVAQELLNIKEVQTTNQCIDELNTAKYHTESAALSIAEDDSYSAKSSLEFAIKLLRHAQVYGCASEDKIVATENKLSEIISLIQ